MSDLSTSSTAPTTAPTTIPHISGTVHGGQQPISGAAIQLYAANITTDLGQSTALLTSGVTTASDGSFSITGDYTCPATNPPVYLVATGGNPGLTGTVNNTDIVLMASLGLCNSLTSSTYVVINEFSTVGMAYLLAPFIQDSTHIGGAPTNPGGMAYYFASAATFDNEPTGIVAGGSLAALELNTFSDILAACVNSPGGTSGDGSACGKLLSLTGGVDTATAAVKMVQTPSNNGPQLYSLISGTPPFQPYFAGVPSDYSATVGYSVPATLRTGTLDSNGHIWLYTGGWTYNAVTNTTTDVQGVITVYDGNFNQLFTVSPGTGGLYYPDSMAADTSGNVYAVNANNTISEFNSTGGAVSPPAGWSTGVATVFTGTATGNTSYVSSSEQVGPIKIDSAGYIWGKSPTNCYFEMNSSRTVVTPAGGTACTTLGGSIDDKGAPDGSGNAWAASFSAIVKVNSSGNVAATATASLGCFATDQTTGDTEYNTTNGVLYDAVTGHVWGYSDTGAGAITDGGSAVFCDGTSATFPAIAPPTNPMFTTGSPVTVNSLQVNSEVLDGAGNLWFYTDGVFATGTATGAYTYSGTVNYSSWLGEVSASGSVLSPFNAGTNTYGYQPAGLGMNVSASETGSTFVTDQPSAGLLGVDNAGNIWATDTYTRRIIKISGLATANSVNY